MKDRLQLMLHAMFHIQWARFMQRCDPSNIQAMIGELDWVCAFHDLVEDLYDAAESQQCERGDHFNCAPNDLTGPCFCNCHDLHVADYFASQHRQSGARD